MTVLCVACDLLVGSGPVCASASCLTHEGLVCVYQGSEVTLLFLILT